MIIIGDCREVLSTLEDESVDCIVTSPPYYLKRDYGHDLQIGAESTWEEYLETLTKVFVEARRILKPEGTIWINIADVYIDGQLIGIPHRLAFALQCKGFFFRQDIIWHKPNAMPAGGTALNRCTPSHEHILFFTKHRSHYHFNINAIMERASGKGEGAIFGGKKYGEEVNHYYESNPYHPTGYRCKRDVWSIPTQSYSGAHFATFPEELPRTCILAGCPEGGRVLDMFSGSGTTGKVAYDLGRQFIGIELNPEYAELSRKRCGGHIQSRLEVEA